MNKRCKISKVCSRKSYSDRNKRDRLAYDIYDRLQETKRGSITQYYCSILYDELFCRTHQLIDSRQNGFLKITSCAMNMTTLIESVSTTLL